MKKKVIRLSGLWTAARVTQRILKWESAAPTEKVYVTRLPDPRRSKDLSNDDKVDLDSTEEDHRLGSWLRGEVKPPASEADISRHRQGQKRKVRR
eukprot:scaffold83043_cov20-Prasinocladus_malaysianus.AAC.1